MDEERLNKDDITCEEGEYGIADLSLKPVDLIIPADAASHATTDPLLAALWLRERIVDEAMAGRKVLHIPAYLGLSSVIDALKELGYAVRQERPGGPWRISWE